MGASKSFREQREAVFHPRDFTLLSNCQAICLPYDGSQSLEPCRVYLKPHYLPLGHSYWRAKKAGRDMSAASGLEHLKPFLPGLESALEDSEVSEIMINGPGNVWVERAGKVDGLRRAGSGRIGPPSGRPSTSPALWAWTRRARQLSMRAWRMAQGWRSVFPPQARKWRLPCGGSASGHSQRRISWRKAPYPKDVRKEAERMLRSRRNILVSGGTGSGKTTLLNALIELLPDDERIVAIEDTLELRIERANCVRFEARGLQEGAVTIRDLVRHALRHRPDHIVVGEVRGGEAADLLQALNTGHGGSLTTVHANNAESALSRIASCAMQGGGELPWEVTCRGVVDGIAMVIHMTRREGRRFVEEAAFVQGYEAAENRWVIQPVWPVEALEGPGEASWAGRGS